MVLIAHAPALCFFHAQNSITNNQGDSFGNRLFYWQRVPKTRTSIMGKMYINGRLYDIEKKKAMEYIESFEQKMYNETKEEYQNHPKSRIETECAMNMINKLVKSKHLIFKER